MIDRFFDRETLSFVYVNQLFQFDNFTHPLTSYLDDTMFFKLDSKTSKSANFFVQRSIMNCIDDIWLGKNVTKSFPSVSNIKSYDDNLDPEEGGSIASIYLRLDKSFDIYDRKVNDVLTLLAAIGGL